MKLPALLLLPLLCVSYAFAAPPLATNADVPTPGAPGIGDMVQPVSGNGGYNVVRYALEMRFKSDLSGYISTSTTQAHATQALSRFNLDLKGNEVLSVEVDGRAAKWTRDGEELQITPPAPIKRDAVFSARVQVRGTIPDYDLTSRQHPDILSIMRSGDFVQTVNQPCGAHWFAALDDAPSQKAPATITIIAPSRLNSISNGELTGTWVDKSDPNFTARRFESRDKLATELIQIGVGPFTIVRAQGPHGIRLRHAVPTAQLKQIEPQLQIVPQVIQFLEERLGPFPRDLYGLYLTPIGSPIETQSITLMSSDDFLPENFPKNEAKVTAAHEASHEYFGNTVSPRRWSDVWLNEGHADFYENVWASLHGGKPLEQRMKVEYQMFDRLVSRSGPVARPSRSSYRDPDIAPYNSLPYVGGAVTLYALQQEVGAATFEKIERAWINKYRDGVAGTSDFINVASEAAGRDLGPFLRSWLYTQKAPLMPGHPDWKSSKSLQFLDGDE